MYLHKNNKKLISQYDVTTTDIFRPLRRLNSIREQLSDKLD